MTWLTSHTTVSPEQLVSRQSLKQQTNCHCDDHKNSPDLIRNIFNRPCGCIDSSLILMFIKVFHFYLYLNIAQWFVATVKVGKSITTSFVLVLGVRNIHSVGEFCYEPDRKKLNFCLFPSLWGWQVDRLRICFSLFFFEDFGLISILY